MLVHLQFRVGLLLEQELISHYVIFLHHHGRLIQRFTVSPSRQRVSNMKMIVVNRADFEYSRLSTEAKRGDLEIGVRIISQK